MRTYQHHEPERKAFTTHPWMYGEIKKMTEKILNAPSECEPWEEEDCRDHGFSPVSSIIYDEEYDEDWLNSLSSRGKKEQ